MSNLLDKASIILTPTAYNNGEALCVKPSDGSGDFDFSRNSAATRVNAQGLVENVQILSSNLVQNGDFSEEGVQEVSNGSFSQEGVELVTNGDFSSDSNWTKQASWSISDGAANYDFLSDAKYIRQTLLNGGFVAGKTYKINFEITSGTAYMNVNSNGGGLISLNTYSVGSYSIYVTASVSGSDLLIYGRNTSGTAFSIDNVSVREVGQDWTIEDIWTIGDGVANGNGANGSEEELTQSFSIVSGKTYKVVYDVLNYVSGTVRFQFSVGGTVSGITRSSDGTFTEYVVASGNHTTFKFRATNFNGSITNISVKEVGQNWDLGNWSVGDSLVLSGATSFLRQVDVFTSTTSIYKTTFRARSVSGASVTLDFYDGANSIKTFTITSSDFEDFELTQQRGGINSILYFYNNSDAEIEITNISVIEITDDTNLPRINYEGFSYQDALGSELVTNGDFSDGSTGWNLGSFWTVPNDKAVCDFPPSTSDLKQLIDITIGNTYLVKYTLSDSQNNGVYMTVLGNSIGYQADGEYSVTVVAINDEAIKARMFSVNAASIDNVSVKEYLGQEVVPDSGCGSWLWEPQTTQLLSYSEDFSQWNAGGDTTIESGYLAPDGTNNAYKVSGTSSALLIDASLLTTTTRSIYARTVSGSGTISLLSKNDNTNNTFTLTEQWQRFEVNSANTTGASSFYAVDFRNPSATLSEVILWGANATNDQDYVTSYIPSNGSTVTRNQDLCTNGGSLASINSTEGTLYFEGSALVGGSNTQISLSDGTSNNAVQLRFDLNSDRLTIFIRGNGGSFAINTITGVTQTDNNKIALVWNATNFRIWLNGLQAGTIATNDLPIGLNTLDFTNPTGASNFQGKTKAVAVWKEALSDAELTELTTI